MDNTQFLLSYGLVSMALEVMKLTFAVLDMSFNSGHYTAAIKRQFCALIFAVFVLYLSTCSH